MTFCLHTIIKTMDKLKAQNEAQAKELGELTEAKHELEQEVDRLREFIDETEQVLRELADEMERMNP